MLTPEHKHAEVVQRLELGMWPSQGEKAHSHSAVLYSMVLYSIAYDLLEERKHTRYIVCHDLGVSVMSGLQRNRV